MLVNVKLDVDETKATVYCTPPMVTVNPPIPTMFDGNAAELVTVGEPLTTVTVIVRSEPILDGLNGIWLMVVPATPTSVAFATTDETSKRSVRRNAFIEIW